MYRACYLATGDVDAAKDATQEAFQRAFARWKRLSQHGWAGGWVMTTALNLCRRQRKRAAREQPLAEPSRPPARDFPSGDRVDLVAGLRSLPHRQRQATILFYLGDLPVPVVAELINLSEGTVKSHLARARSALRSVLEVVDD